MATFINPLFIDIETVSRVASYAELSPRWQALWCKKAKLLGAKTEEEQAALFFEKAGIFAEFGKVVVIAFGYIEKNQGKQEVLRFGSMADENEKSLLKKCKTWLSKFPSHIQLCGHNGKEFDFPYLSRRMIVHGIALPSLLNTSGKKPWEVNHRDTMELWKFGDRKNFTSLDLLSALFGIPSSKEEMDGSEVNTYYYHKKDLQAIEKYCIKDVVNTVQVYRKIHGQPLIAPASMFSVEKEILKKQGVPLFNN